MGKRKGGWMTKIVPNIRVNPKNILYNLKRSLKNIADNTIANIGELQIMVKASPIGNSVTEITVRNITTSEDNA